MFQFLFILNINITDAIPDQEVVALRLNPMKDHRNVSILARFEKYAAISMRDFLQITLASAERIAHKVLYGG